MAAAHQRPLSPNLQQSLLCRPFLAEAAGKPCPTCIHACTHWQDLSKVAVLMCLGPGAHCSLLSACLTSLNGRCQPTSEARASLQGQLLISGGNVPTTAAARPV